MLQNVASIREAGQECRSWSVSAEREAAAQNLFAGMTLMRPEMGFFARIFEGRKPAERHQREAGFMPESLRANDPCIP